MYHGDLDWDVTAHSLTRRTRTTAESRPPNRRNPVVISLLVAAGETALRRLFRSDIVGVPRLVGGFLNTRRAHETPQPAAKCPAEDSASERIHAT